MNSVSEAPTATDLKLEQALEREAATREILQAISRSAGDEAPVFEVILETALRLCDTPQAGIYLVDAERTQIDLLAERQSGKPVGDMRKTDPLPMSDTGSSFVEAVLTREPVHIVDLKDTARYRDGSENRRAAVDVAKIRTLLQVPMREGEDCIGVLCVCRRDVRAFSDAEIRLLETLAAQAVIAIRNARHVRELQARLDREAATNEILGAISRSRDDEMPVFDVILERALGLSRSTTANLFLVSDDGGWFDLVTHQGNSDTLVGFYRSNPTSTLDRESSLVRSLESGEPVQILDTRDTERYRTADGLRRRAADELGIRTVLQVPLMSGPSAFGVLSLHRAEVRAFAGDEIALLKTFAAQAVIAIENVRQFRELQSRLRREAATGEVLGVISHSRDDESPVFDAIVERAASLCDARTVRLHLLSEDETETRLSASWGAELKSFKTGDRFSIRQEGPVSRSIRERRAIPVVDLTSEQIYQERDPTRVELVKSEGLRSFVAVPLISGDRAIGAMTLGRREVKAFSPDEIELVQTFAAQAVIAIENVRQFRALQSRTSEVQTLNASLEERVSEQVGEIERMGRLKRFLPHQVADAVISAGDEKILRSHRTLIGVLFCDIRGFTAFCETAEPEETIEVLQAYHEEMGKLIAAHGAGVDHRSGDGIMVIFNDPLPCDDPAGDAVRLALAMQARMGELCRRWRKLGHRLGFGVGISLGYATVGMVGSEGRYEYTASGTAVNLGARLCDQAKNGEILMSLRAATAVEEEFPTEAVGEVDLKGIREPVEIFRLVPPDAG